MPKRIIPDYNGGPLVVFPEEEATLKNIVKAAQEVFPNTPFEEIFFESHGPVSAYEVGMRKFPSTDFQKSQKQGRSLPDLDTALWTRPTLAGAMRDFNQAGEGYSMEDARIYWSTDMGWYRLHISAPQNAVAQSA